MSIYLGGILEKKNCWEVKGCGREEGGLNAKESGVCPSSKETRLDGVHGGINGGRACWVIAGTLCNGQPQGTFAQKYKDCCRCDFYSKVKSEEGSNFQLSATLLSQFKNE